MELAKLCCDVHRRFILVLIFCLHGEWKKVRDKQTNKQ